MNPENLHLPPPDPTAPDRKPIPAKVYVHPGKLPEEAPPVPAKSETRKKKSSTKSASFRTRFRARIRIPRNRKPPRQVWLPPQLAALPQDRLRRVKQISLVCAAALFGALSGLMLIYSVDLPQINDLTKYQPIATTEIFDVHGEPVGSFALQRRVVDDYEGFPWVLRQAVISIEDKNFESHWGVNVFRVFGAAYRDLTSVGRMQGASTLTMQLARNLFLSSDRTFSRKLQEVILSLQIEHHFTKPQIFALYANQIYLGSGIYGFEAAAQHYFNKHAGELTLPEAALLAGLPKAPSSYNPIAFPDRALARRNVVLDEMEKDGVITPDQAEDARETPLGLHIQPPPNTEAPWFVEEIRRELDHQYGDERIYEGGLRIYTTVDMRLQRSANQAVAQGLNAYEHRRGWTGNLRNVIAAKLPMASFEHPDWALMPRSGDYVHAMVTFVQPQQVSLRIGKQRASMAPTDWTWTGYSTADKFLKPGDIVYVHLVGDTKPDTLWHAQLEQDSGAQAAFFAVDNATGDVVAMVGGRDPLVSQYNRATQSERQTGSSFKPYVYTAAVEAGARPGDTILDAPVSFAGYTPHNYDNGYQGNISLLAAFADSRNIPALKLAAHVGIRKVIEVAHRFGITENIPPFLPVALGSADVTLCEQVAAYSVFPNDGLLVQPRLIRKISTPDGRVIQEPPMQMKQIISLKTARTMRTFLEEVTRAGTAAAAAQLKHPLGGKTGTTNDFTDAWFIGFSPSVTAGVWVGYDDRQSLGEKETGSKAALPIWMDFMRTAIAEHPGETFADTDVPSLKAPVTEMASAATAHAPAPTAAKLPSAAHPPIPRQPPATLKPASATAPAIARTVAPVLSKPTPAAVKAVAIAKPSPVPAALPPAAAQP